MQDSASVHSFAYILKYLKFNEFNQKTHKPYFLLFMIQTFRCGKESFFQIQKNLLWLHIEPVQFGGHLQVRLP